MSVWGQDSLSVNIGTPVVLGGSAITSYVEAVSGYTHTTSTEHGFDSAQIDLSLGDEEIADWLEHGLGRDVSTFNAAGTEVWNGIVDTVSIRHGVRSIVIGPVSEIANRIAVLFSDCLLYTSPSPRDRS